MRFRKKIDKTLNRFRLVNDTVLENCLKYLADEYVKRAKEPKSKPLNVVFTDEDEGRTAAQNRLMWMWYEQIGKVRGMTKYEVHDEMRAKFLLTIYRMHDASYEAVASDYIGDKLGAEEWTAKMHLGRMCSTTASTATVEIMDKYLRDIEVWAYANGIPLTIPADLRWVREGNEYIQ